MNFLLLQVGVTPRLSPPTSGSILKMKQETPPVPSPSPPSAFPGLAMPGRSLATTPPAANSRY